MSLTSYRAAPPRDPEDVPIMPELLPYASAILKNVKNYRKGIGRGQLSSGRHREPRRVQLPDSVERELNRHGCQEQTA